MPNPSRPTLAEIYNTLNQLVEAYSNVMMTFSSVVTDVAELRGEIAALQEFNRGMLADAVTARDIWRATAEAHKIEVDKLRAQLAAAAGCGDGG